MLHIAPRLADAANLSPSTAFEERSDWLAPDGKVYDVVRLTGPTATVSADAGQHVRVRFLDKHGDLVNADFSGKGQLTVTLDAATASPEPIEAALYSLPGLVFMQGDAVLTIQDSDSATGLRVFASGSATEADPSVLKPNQHYEGMADIVRVAIISAAPPAHFGSIDTSNVRYSATSGVTGIATAAAWIEGDVRIGDLVASGTATPTLTFGQVNRIYVCGGDLLQLNGKKIQISGFSAAEELSSIEGNDANGTVISAQSILGEFQPVAAIPSILTHPSSTTVAVGANAALTVGASNAATFGWEQNGVTIEGATTSGLTITNVQPTAVGVYRAFAINGAGNTVSRPAILGLTTSAKVTGNGLALEPPDIMHPAGYIYDQVLMTGPALSVTADPEQVTRLNFIDLDDDIVQVEFSGPGTLSVVLDNATAPAPAVKYNQPVVNYVKGHAGLVIAGASEQTQLSITSVGRSNAINQSLFKSDVVYDGIADIAFVAVLSNDGQFGGINAANVNFFASQGLTGIFAPGVAFTGPVRIGEVSAFGAATPVLVCANVTDLRVEGGSLAQPNGRMVQTAGFSAPAGVQFIAGVDSHGRTLPARTNQAQFEASPAPGTAPAITSAGTATFVVGQPGTFAVETTGSPTPIVAVASGSWPSWATLSGTGVISGIPPSTEGSPFTFTLQASNAQGAPATQTFTLTVFDPLSVAPLADQTVTAGNSVTFTAAASGGGSISYQWRHDGWPLSGATEASYTIPSVTMLDAGTYDVVVSRGNEELVSGAGYLIVAPTSYPEVMRVDPAFRPMIEKAGGYVHGLARQADGKLIVAGEFSRISGIVRPNLARIDRFGQVDSTFDPGEGPNGRVHRIALLPDGRLFVAGEFTSYAGVLRNHVARINADGTIDHSFDPGAGPDDELLAMVVQPDGKVLLGGSFSTFSGVARKRVVRLNTDGSVDPSFDAGSGPSGWVTALALQPDGKIIVAGSFATCSGVARRSIARLNPDGSLDSEFVPATETNYNAKSLAVQFDGKILLGGDNFNTPQPNLLRLTANGALDASFPAAVTNPILALMVQPDGKILAGVADEADAFRRGVARLNPDGSMDSTFEPGPILTVNIEALVLEPDGSIVIGSGTQILPTPDAHRVLRLTAAGAKDPAFGAPLRSLATVREMARQPDGKLVIAGDFEYVNNAARTGIARLTSDGAVDETFNAGAGADDPIDKLLLQPDGKILIAGWFDVVAGSARKRLARLNSNGSVDSSFDPGSGPDGLILAVALQGDGRVLIGGQFSSYQGTSRPYVARLEPNGTLDSSFRTGTGPNGSVDHIVFQRNGRIVIAGRFTSVDGTSRQRFALLNADGSIDPAFVPAFTDLDPSLCGVWPLANGGLLASFASYEGLKRFTPSGALDDTFVTTHLASEYWVAGAAVVQADGKILLGLLQDEVIYTRANSVGLLRLGVDGVVDPGFSIADFRNAEVSQIFQLDDGELLVAGTRFSDGRTTQGGVARLTRATSPTFTSEDQASFAIGASNALRVTAGGSPFPHFSVIAGDFPPWARLDPASGVISGTPLNAAGSPFTFVLEAANGVGVAATQTFTLSVENGSIVVAPVQDQTATAGTSVTWSASVSGETPASYQWRLNGQPIAGATSSSYTIPAAALFAAGRYDVVVTSAGGESFTSAAGTLVITPSRYPGAMQLDPTFAPLIENAGGTIHSIARQSDGRLIVSGSFSRINGVLRRNLARLNADGTVDDSFDPGLGPDQPVFRVALQPDGKILLGGEFLRYDGVARSRIARVNQDGSLDQTFAAGAGADGRIEAIAVQSDGKILLGGWFASLNGSPRPRIARLEADGSVDLTFDAGNAAATMDLVVLSDGRILAAGPFTEFGGVARNGVVRLAANGAVDVAFVPETWSGLDATSLAVQPDGKVIIGASSFEQTGPDLLRLNADGTRDTGFIPPALRHVDAVAILSDGRILVGGAFRNSGSVRYQVARLQSNGALDGSFNSSGRLDFDIEALVPLPSGEIAVGGRTLLVEGSSHNTLGRLKASGSLDTSFSGDARSPGIVEALVRQPTGALLIGGSFNYVNGAVRKRVARLGADGALDPDFAPAVTLVGGATGAVTSVSTIVAQPDGKIVVAGFFNRINGTVRERIARLLPNGSVDLASDSAWGTDTWVSTAAIQPDGKILLGGLFSTYAGVTRNTLARINPNGSLDKTFDPGQGANWSVSQLVLQPDGRALVCGGFTSFAGVSRKGVVRINNDGTLDTSFGATNGLASTAESLLLDPSGIAYVGRWDGITRLTASGSIDATYTSADLSDVGNIGVIYRQADGRLIVGQDITSGSDGPTIGIARVNANGTRDTSFTVLDLTEARLSAIEVLEDGRMLIAGTTFNDGTMEQFGLARLMFVPAPSITQPPANATINVGQTGTFSVVAAGEGPFTYQWRKAGDPITGNASATTATLTITNVQLADAGDYDVVVTNLGGTTTSSPATLVVYLPPQITSQPADRTIIAGGSASFSVVATGSPTPTYQWRRNGAALPGATGASLTLADVPANGGGAITVVVTNAGGFLESEPATLTVNPIAPEFAAGLPATATAIQGRGFYFPVVTNTTPAVFTAPGLEAAGGTLTINSSSGAISGVPANLGSFAVTLTATNSTGSDTHVLDLVVQPPPPVITSAAAASGRTDTAFNFAVVATNTPSTYSATGLPDGLMIDAGTGEIHGTATVAGTYTVQLTVTNASGAITQPFILTIAPPPNTPVYTGTLSAAGVQGVAFSFTPAFGTVTAPYTLIGSLPAGLSFAPTTGVISGTPDAMGSFPVKLSATNAAGTTTVDLTIVINPAPTAPVITSASVAPVAHVGNTFSFALTSSGTPFASSYSAAPLPAGLTLDPSTGVISGVPAAFGTYNVDVAATNSIGTGPEAVLIVTIVPSVGAPVVNSAPIALGRVGVPFTYTLAASNDPASFGITTGTLPDGLHLDATSGTITGNPEATAVGESRVWFNATNGSGVGIPSEVLFRIAPAPTTPVIISNGTAIAQVGQPFQYVIATRSDSAVTGYEAAGLPAWLTLNATTGVLAGIPNEPTSAPISVSLSATNANGTGSTKVLQLTTIPAPATPRITSSLTALGRVGTVFSYQISASDSPTSFLATGLPAGLALDPSSGLITGTPASADTFEVILRAANANGLGGAATLKLGLAPALDAPSITSAATATGQVGAAFTYQITASNGPILSYAVSGALPRGLTFNSATGEITGKPADDPRIYSVNLTASATAGISSPQPLLIAIAPAVGVPVLTTSEYVIARVGEPFSYTITASNLSGTAPYAPPILLDAVNLPAGLAVNPATGVIQGSPTEAGTSTATLTATNAAGTSAARDLTFTIRPASAAPLLEPAGEVAAQVGQAFSYQIIAGNAPDRYETLDAPGWMHVNATTGFITGVPEAPGTWVVRLVAANAAGSSSPVPLRVIVAPAANTPLVTSSRTHVGTVGTAMSFTIEAAPTMPAVTFAATGLPPGLTLNTATGVVDGTPVESGTFEVIVTPTSSSGTGAPAPFTITIRPNVTFGS